MAWIESHQSLHKHPKLVRLSNALKITRPQAIGHLHIFWWWCIDYAPNGQLFKFTPLQIAEAADWNGSPEEFVKAIEDSEFIDRVEEGLQVHDWLDFCGELVKQRCRRLKEKRRKMRHVLPSKHRHPTGPNQPDQQNQTKPNQPVLMRFEEFWKAYPDRDGKKVLKAKAMALFLALSDDEQVQCVAAAKAYARHCRDSKRLPKDPPRFIKGQDGELWRDFIPQEPKQPMLAVVPAKKPIVGEPCPPEAADVLKRIGVNIPGMV